MADTVHAVKKPNIAYPRKRDRVDAGSAAHNIECGRYVVYDNGLVRYAESGDGLMGIACEDIKKGQRAVANKANGQYWVKRNG